MITAIVVNHNGERDLDRCLGSLRAAEDDLEIIVVDNASADASVERVRSAFPDVRILEQSSNVGFGAANNRAAREALGDTLLLLNCDAWLEPGALAALDHRLRADDRIALVAPRLTYPDGSLQFVWSPARGVLGEVLQKLRNPFERWPGAHGRFARVVSRAVGRPWYTAACALVRADAFHQVGGFDEDFFMYFEDVDLCVRLEAAGWRFAHEPRAVARHRGGFAHGSATDEMYRPSQLRYYRKHRPAWERRLIERRLRRRFGPDAVARWQAKGSRQ